MIVSVVADPTNWGRWPEAVALLKPAQDRGGFPTAIEPDEELFAVLDGDELLACATAWFSVDDAFVEVKLVGGRDRHKWLKQLDDVIGAAARGAGATRLTACGRRGWLRELSAMGWDRIGEVDGSFIYARNLKD